MVDLDREFALTTDGVSPLVVKRFLQWGIPPRIIYGPRHHVGVARIVTTSDGFFEFHETGARAAIVPEGVPEWPAWDEIHDLVARKLLTVVSISPWPRSSISLRSSSASVVDFTPATP